MLRNKPPWRGAAWPPLGLKGGGGRKGDLASNNNQAIDTRAKKHRKEDNKGGVEWTRITK